jgi:hypothetical protein
VRVTATVNGVEYIYPNLPGVDWLEIGPEMAGQTFQLPLRDTYLVRFSAEIRERYEHTITPYVSVEEQRINRKTDGPMTYAIREVERGQRAAPAAAEIIYEISRNAR